MDIKAELKLYEKFFPLEDLLRRVELPTGIMKEEPTAIIPTIVLDAGGLAMPSLVIVTRSYLCEVDLQQQPLAINCDFSAKGAYEYFNVRMWMHEIKDGETIKASFQAADISLYHKHPNIVCHFRYVGDDRDSWLGKLWEAIPIKTILQDGG